MQIVFSPRPEPERDTAEEPSPEEVAAKAAEGARRNLRHRQKCDRQVLELLRK
eukprot:COSAG01_NODE_27480_length_684_cov_13.153846_1_plen_52_part_10